MGNVIHTADGRLASTTLTDVQTMVNAAIDRGNVVVHIHGGLVSESSARDIAARLSVDYGPFAAPLFPVWEAGLFETISNNLGSLVGETLFRVLLKRVTAIGKRKFGQSAGDRAAATLPALDLTDAENSLEHALDSRDPTLLPPDPAPPVALAELSEGEKRTLEGELAVDMEFQQVMASVSAGLRTPAEIAASDGARGTIPIVASTQTLMDPAAIERYVDRPTPEARGLLSIARIAKGVITVAARVIKRFIADSHHGLHATVVEEILREFYLANIGGVIWSAMKTDTKDCFGADPSVHGGTAMLRVLAERVAASREDGSADPRVTLVGHSTGAVYITHLLEKADAMLPLGFKFDIVFLAPAATCELVADGLVSRSHRVRGFRMFTMSDENEKNDRLVPVLYPHSLLYFISGVLESRADVPIVGMQRFYHAEKFSPQNYPKVDAVRRFLHADPKRAVWSKAVGTPGFESESLDHTDFDNDDKTLDSIKYLLQHGF